MGSDRGGYSGAAHQARAASDAGSEAGLHRLDVQDGEIRVSSDEQSEMCDLLELAAGLGWDPLAIQGPGGNISLKRDGVMWVKASGTWMMEAMTRSILVPVDIAAVLDGLAADAPACATCSGCAHLRLVHSTL